MLSINYCAAFTALFLVLIPMAHADDTEDNRRSLRGLKGVEIFVTKITPEAEQNGLTRSAIQTDVELKLRQAGIQVLDTNDGSSWLAVQLDVGTNKSATWLYSIKVELHQSAVLVRDPSILAPSAVTWGLGTYGDIRPENVRRLREYMKDLVDRFINAYLSVNPKK